MALTRAQYLAPGGSSPALAGQVQGVKQGTGITIAADGTISFNAGSATGVVTSVAASGGTTGLTFSGSPITSSGTLTLGGVLAIANGGTGSSTSSGSLNNLLPSQAGNAGRVLSTNGTNVLWAVDGGGTVTSVNASGGTTGLFFNGGPITTSGTLQLNGVLAVAHGGTGSSTSSGSINNLLPSQTGNAGRFLTTNGSNISWGTVAPGGVTQIIAGSNVTISPVTGTGAVTINATGGGGGGGLTGLQEIDDISGSFNGSTLSFPITVSGGQPIPAGPGTSQLVIAVGGIVQTPGVAFTFDNATDTITFTSAPAAGLTFAGYVGGNANPITAITTSAPLSGGGTSGTVNISATLATAAQAAAGTSATVLMTPQFTVPKNASGMTGAAILPSGTDAQRAAIASPVVGMQRYNTDSGFGEVYTGATTGWKRVAWANPQNITNDLTYSANTTLDDGVYICRNLTINSGVTISTNRQSLVFYVYGDAVINGNIGNVLGPKGGSQAVAFSGGSPGFGLGSGITVGSGASYTPSVCLVGSGAASGVIDISLGGSVGAGDGGQGGGNFSVIAQGTITQGASSTISCVGGTGTGPYSGSGSFRVSGAGGGSGGSIILQANGNITVAGTLAVYGGDGGPAAAGGAGGAGGTGAFGGSGGGGGVVILQTPATLTNTATINLAGGAVGASAAGTTPLGSGGGGSFGGVGGGSNAAGTAGLLLTNGSPF